MDFKKLTKEQLEEAKNCTTEEAKFDNLNQEEINSF